MLAIGMLMIEHRLIEKVIAMVGREGQRIAAGGEPDFGFLLGAVDFIRTYADRLHHGKEEDILFKTLDKKPLSPEHRKMMEQLIAEHQLSRDNTKKIADAAGRYHGGDKSAAKEIADAAAFLSGLYPRHISMEDRQFFMPVMAYLTKEEQAAMLAEAEEFDKKFVHGVYKEKVDQWLKK